MIARFASLLAALLVAVMPIVRAMCDVGCVTVPAHEAQSAPTAAHCASAAAPESDQPPSGDDCGHNHDASDAMVTAVKSAIATSPALAPSVAPIGAATFAPTAVLVPTQVLPPPPPSIRPLPLRI